MPGGFQVHQSERNARIVALIGAGQTPRQIAEQEGLTRNTVIGIKARARLCRSENNPVGKFRYRSMNWRLDELNRKMDAVLEETALIIAAARYRISRENEGAG